MKNLFKLFGIMAILIATISCSEDIFLKGGEDGQDGKDGIDGVDGKDAENPVFTTEKDWISDLCWIRTILRDGTFFYSDTLCNGQDGQDGKDGKDFNPDDLVFSYEVIELDELCDMIFGYLNDAIIFAYENCDGAPGEDGEAAEPYNPDWDLKKNKISELCKEIILYVDGEERFRDTICNGESSSGNIYIDIPDYQEEFNHPEGTDHYLAKEWELSCGVEIDLGDNSNGIGTLYLQDADETFSGWGRTPNFTERLLTGVELQVGSSEPWEIAIFGQRFNGEWVFLYEIIIEGNPHFVYNDLSTYEYVTWYLPSLDPEIIDYGDDFKRIEVGFWWRPEGEKKSAKCILERNESLNIASVKVAGVKIPEIN